MKTLLPLLIIYAIVTMSDGIHKVTYDGMTVETVRALLDERVNGNPGMTYRLVREKEFMDTPDPFPPTPIPDPTKVQAILDAKNSSNPVDVRIKALMTATDLK